MIGGVAPAIAARCGVDVTVVRVLLVLFALSGGFGVTAYVAAWLFIPFEGDDTNIASRALGDRRAIRVGVALIPLVAIVLIVDAEVGAPWLNSFCSAMLLAAGGLVLIWRNASEPEQVIIRRLARPAADLLTPGMSRRSLWLRLGIGLAFTIAGLATLVSGSRTSQALHPIAGLVLMAAAVVVTFGPWWLRIARDLVAERQARARAEERAEIASRVHDSVLQTLALIQRQADQPQQVVQLARAQERELRSWLFDGEPPGSANRNDSTFSAGVKRIQDEVEAAHGVAVEIVVVGDCPLDDELRSLLDAAREATVNAAKWSGAPVVSLYAEVEDESVSVFVRDRGRGFVPEEVAADRKGISESVQGRMARAGGTAAIRSAPGNGTEIELRLLVAAPPAPRRSPAEPPVRP